MLGRATDATTLEIENLSHRNKSLKELTTETEHMLPILSFLPLQRRILNLNAD